MRHFFQLLEHSQCLKCRFARAIPCSDLVTCTSPSARITGSPNAKMHDQPYWPVAFDPKRLPSCPCRSFREMQTAA
jgi:hypothetical protein